MALRRERARAGSQDREVERRVEEETGSDLEEREVAPGRPSLATWPFPSTIRPKNFGAPPLT